ncbi:serine hydrolase domain-containing protein [Corynebacterium pelargi]|uniref:Putative periplasmic esterase n=1 Tax=Corynebacterium pelargi TaxID=1471400 RepID=A0A410W7K5_9CORY|nr:serine hydrolase domain-containing protein [Corynebacterium pelargi]QAU51929.1 putative periplasmic esterase [Corynebacterium pelargi]GGG71398.1 serine hydrolase [Corynebacterium pelargi]
MSLLAPFEAFPVEHLAAGVITEGEEYTLGDTDREFELASVTKLLATYGFLLACEEEVFTLDSPCGPATVRHLLAHASGVGFRSDDATRPAEQRRVYSSYGFELLAQQLEQETHMTFAEYLHEAVLVPLGMDATVLWGSPGHEARSTLGDMLRFAHELIDPQLLHPSTLEQAFEVQFPTLDGVVPGYGMQKPCPWGLGFEIKGEKSPHWTGVEMPEDTVGHFGQSGTFLWLAPKQRRAAVMLSDRDFGAWAKPLWQETNDVLWRSLQQGK